jgi:signal recognition particle subunit SRP54
MIPGVGKAIKDIDIDDNAFKSVEAMIGSMTPYEREHPECINMSRKQRISKGSGVSMDEVNRVTKQFEQMRKMMHMMTGSKMASAMKQMQRMKGMPGMPKF